MEPVTYEKIIAVMENDRSDVCIFNYYSNTETLQKKAQGYQRAQLIDDEEMIYKISLAGLVGRANPIIPGRLEGWPWNKVYRRSVYETLEKESQLFIDRVRHYDDALFNIRMMQKCRCLSISPIYGYHYRIGNTESITGRYYQTLPSKEDFMWYQKFGKELALDGLWETVLNTMQINLFCDYVNKHHYFQPQNPQTRKDQIREIDDLLKGKYKKNCYFPIQTSLKKGNTDWIANRAMRFMAKHNMVSARTIYLGRLVSRCKRKLACVRKEKRNGRIECDHSDI